VKSEEYVKYLGIFLNKNNDKYKESLYLIVSRKETKDYYSRNDLFRL